MAILTHLENDLFDFLAGKGVQACVRILEDGSYEVVGKPRAARKHAVSAESLENVSWLLSRADPEWLAKCARDARRYGSIRTGKVGG